MRLHLRHEKAAPDRVCHGPSSDDTRGLPQVVIVGSPNVGKSLIFNKLTGAYVAVSNYPGTTVAIDRGRCRLNGREFGVVDSPGMYSLLPITEEERIAKRLLLEERPAIVLHVIDAKNLDRMLPFSLQLIEANLPLIMAVNMMDEAEKLGMSLDFNELEGKLGVPIVPVVATTGKGVRELIERMSLYASKQPA